MSQQPYFPMNRSRQFRVAAALIALFSMLFMQLAVASYVCPGMKTGNAVDMAAMSMGGMNHHDMPGCQGTDQVQTGLCHAHMHDQASKQALDKSELPAVQPFVAIGLVLTLDVADVTAHPPAVPPESSLLRRATAPPIAIRNCCFRI